MMVDREDRDTGIFTEIRFVLGQREDGALGQLPGPAFAGKSAIGRFMSGEREVGSQLGGLAVYKTIGGDWPVGLQHFPSGLWGIIERLCWPAMNNSRTPRNANSRVCLQTGSCILALRCSGDLPRHLALVALC